ncbi:MAG: VWA domain-containing protein [Promethearchaeota archaeon]
MSELKVFVDVNENTTGKVVVCQENATKLGVSNGASVEVENPDNGKKISGTVEISNMVLDFAAQISRNIVDILEFSGVELIIRPASQTGLATPTQMPKVPSSAPQPQPQTQPGLTPLPTPPPQIIPPIPQPTPPSKVQQISTPTPQPTYTPTPQPKSVPQPPVPTPTPQVTPTPIPSPSFPTPGSLQPSTTKQDFGAQATPAEQYPNRIDVYMLQSQKGGVILTPVIDNNIEGGRVQLSSSIIHQLGLASGLLIAWEDPLTRSTGSARINEAMINPNEIRMSRDTKEDTNIRAEQILVYSTEPPIEKASVIMLEVQSQPNLLGYCLVSPRTQYTLSINQDDILAFEDELTGAIGAAKVEISEATPSNTIIIDSEILEASGIGSFEVKVYKNLRPVISLQNVALGINPISGENMWEIISTARQNVESLKGWLSNYIIFKGIKLRWSSVNIACSLLNTVPDLTGDIFAQITPNTAINLTPTGLIPFNAILIIDISRSMMARDVFVTNIAPAIEGIKAAMESREIQEFLVHFKPGVNIPRRIAAAFAAVLFLSEKVGRGFGEKVSVIRFADEAQILPFMDSFYMDSASGKKGVLEDAARMIVDRIGNAYGQATNMGQAMAKAHQVLTEFDKMNPDQPTMVVLLTDGVPTDGDDFFKTIKLFAENPNVVIYIVGLGNPERELMIRAASLCGGEYFEPEDAGELLIWYSKRARDLTVKLKAHKHEI